jgi:CHAD domain-containing protein
MASEGKNGKRRSSRKDEARLRELTDALKQALAKCGDDPDGDAVHDVRTGTRRIEALLEWRLREAQLRQDRDDLEKAVRAWERLLKKIRRAAGPVRDLDVQQKLLKSLEGWVEAKIRTPLDEPESGMAGQVEKLDDALKADREDGAARLKKNAPKWAAKLEKHVAEVDSAAKSDGQGNGKSGGARNGIDAASAALDEYRQLAKRMPKLDAGNLHDFRKGAKKARYMAEAGGEDDRAKDVGKALKKVQDAIGDWHDWLLLAEEAHTLLDRKSGGKKRARLTAEIERMRDAHFEIAMKMERKIRRRLAA